MKTPICESCAWQDTLCPACQKKLAGGKISRLDIEVAQMLHKINENHNITAASFVHAYDLGRIVLILTEGEVGLLIGREGKVVSALSVALGKKVRIAKYSSDVKKSIADVITPAKLLGINTAFCNGREVVRVRLARSEQHLLPLTDKDLCELLKSWMGHEVEIKFE